MGSIRRRMQVDLRLRNYAPTTERIYLLHAGYFVRYFRRSPRHLGAAHVRRYLLYLVEERKCSWSWWRQAVAALRFLYGTTLGRRDVIPHIPFPRRERRLPVVLTRGEVRRVLREVEDLRNRVALMAIYSAGLRISEAIHLSPADIDPAAMTIHVRRGKGRRDRMVPLATTLLHGLRQVQRRHRDGRWLLPGRRAGRPISVRAVQRAMTTAVERAHIRKRATPRALRHSFATHHLEAGTDIRIIQRLLGHASIASTMIYVHVSTAHLASVASPLDELGLGEAPVQLRMEL